MQEKVSHIIILLLFLTPLNYTITNSEDTPFDTKRWLIEIYQDGINWTSYHNLTYSYTKINNTINN